MWEFYYSDEDFRNLKGVVSAQKYAQFKALMNRCQRLDKKHNQIEADKKQVEKLRIREENEYFAYWGVFSEEQLKRFRKDPAFCQAEQEYRKRKDNV